MARQKSRRKGGREWEEAKNGEIRDLEFYGGGEFTGLMVGGCRCSLSRESEDTRMIHRQDGT